MAYEVRDKAYKDWYAANCCNIPELRHLNAGVEEAFKAGWEARKKAEYKARLNPVGMEYYSPVQGR